MRFFQLLMLRPCVISVVAFLLTSISRRFSQTNKTLAMWPIALDHLQTAVLFYSILLGLPILSIDCRKINSQASSSLASRNGGYNYDSASVQYTNPQQPLLPQQIKYVFGAVELPTLAPDTSTVNSSYPFGSFPAYFCRSTTARAHVDCPCLLIGEKCFQANSICLADPQGDGFCGCISGYVPYNQTCVTLAYYNQNVLMTYVISAPLIVASCFLPANAVIGNIPYVYGTPPITYNLTLLYSNINGSGGNTIKYISVDQTTGNILFLRPAPATVRNQTYQVTARDASGMTSTIIFKVIFNCTAPTCSIDVGSPIYVECQLNGVGSTIGNVLAAGSVAPTRYSMVLAWSTSTLGNTYYSLDPFTGMIQIQKALHGGIFSEVYNVTATNGVNQRCTVIQVKITTSADCT